MQKMSLAVHREPRKTAGNRMSKLLDAEEEDEFYKTTYGGFNDVRSNPPGAQLKAPEAMSVPLYHFVWPARANQACQLFHDACSSLNQNVNLSYVMHNNSPHS